MAQEPNSLDIVSHVVRYLKVNDCALLSCYAASNDKSLPMFLDSSSNTPEGEIERLFRNVRKESRVYDA